MRLTVLGGCGAWPEPGQACSGYMIEHDGFLLVVELGYATMPRLIEYVDAGRVDAVYISHAHPDHCADLNPLLRARALRDNPAPPLAIYSPAGALDAVLALDRHETLAGSYQLHDVAPGASLEIGPFRADVRLLPHWLPNLGLRLSAAGRVLAYTGDTGPSEEVVHLAKDVDLLLAEATYTELVPDDARQYMSSAGGAARQAAAAGAGRLLLTHLWPGSDQAAAIAAAAAEYHGDLGIATAGLAIDLS
ncbi:MAG TPA: MBL fold metallo-hydrolase [Streptosporangiaceae bacterium]|nr:MBL fold metallo-hydrolase [Streptosporangiaceae bacterium]